jgi:hypothetical protein
MVSKNWAIYSKMMNETKEPHPNTITRKMILYHTRSYVRVLEFLNFTLFVGKTRKEKRDLFQQE